MIDDDGYVLPDAQAILVCVATRNDPQAHWFPADAQTRGQVVLWLSVAEDITRSASAARLHDAFDMKTDVEGCRRAAHALFAQIEDTSRTSRSMAMAGWSAVRRRWPTVRAFPTSR